MFASPLGDKLAFYTMSGREALSRPFVYQVDLLSEDDSVDLLALLGKPVSVALERTDGVVREFNGVVTNFSLVGQHGNYARYRAIMRPWLWLLGMNQSSRVFQPDTVPNIVQALFRERGFSDFETSIAAGSYRKWDYLMQYRESDLNFVSRLLEQEGIHYFFRHDKGKHVLVLADSNTAHKTTPGYETVPYFPPHEREQRAQEHVDTWVTSRQLRPGALTAADFDFTKPAIVSANASAPLKTDASGAEIYDYPGEFTESADADAQVKLRLEEHQVEHELVEGAGPVRGLGTGSRFTLSQFPRDDQNKEYLVQSASYELRVSEYESNVTDDSESNFAFSFTALDAKRPYRAPRLTKKPVVEGPQTAIVVGQKNQEIFTDEYGRVKLQFHWDREGKHDENSSCWVRVSQLWAGTQWGAIHLPRVGQEVIVEFLEGDPDRPIVTGRVYNQENMPPYALPDNRTQSGIKSRSSSGGDPNNFNEIRFEDKKGSEELHVQAEKDMTTLVKHDRSATIQRNDNLSVEGDQFIHVHGNLSLTVDGVTDSQNPDKGKPIKSSMAVTGAHDMKASDSISMSAPNKITLTVGSSSITITPGAITISAGGGASIALDANMLAAAKGGGQVKLDANVLAQSKPGSKLQLDGEALTSAQGGASVKLNSDVTAASSGQSKLTLDANAAVKSTTGNVTLEGMQVEGKGTVGAKIQGPTGSVECSAASTDVKGVMVNVNGTGMVSISGPLVKIN
ncbi:MAG TPA: type VI secretion system tip protein TssI/VgrG [Polyangiaceae bacterium]|nr:type VI secretion system tip protein TssI/VgrG [Polyangiaceae bacterium]